jgi:hypothetical protein
MMVCLILYAYCRGVYSSRKIAKACEERVDFMAVTARQKPDFRTINDFRKRHLKALQGLFKQVLQLCRHQGLVKLGHVATDGTKMQANASRRKAMSYGRMDAAEESLQAEVDRWFAEADRIDAEEDQLYGEDQRGDELPDWIKSRQKRIEKIQEARRALEEEAKAKAETERAENQGKPRKGKQKKPPEGIPEGKAQRNFTDPESRIMKTSKGFDQCYNAQAAVDAESQVIVGQRLTNRGNDRKELLPMLEHIEENLQQRPREVSADSDYHSEEVLGELKQLKIRGYVAVGKHSHGKGQVVKQKPKPGTHRYEMMMRLRKGGYRSRYRLRKQTVEPVFGQIKHARGFRQFLLRGIEKVEAEWSLICTAHNLLKLAQVQP